MSAAPPSREDEAVDPVDRADALLRDLDAKGGYEGATAAIEKVMQDLSRCTDEEQRLLEADLADLRAMLAKLEQGRVEIAVFGEIDTGKSAMVNALVGDAVTEVSVRGGWTKQVWGADWDAAATIVSTGDGEGAGASRVVLLDTPGINEVGGEQRAEMARDAAAKADLILFVTDSDLNEIEMEALRMLVTTHRPIVLALNKKDLYTTAQRDELLATLIERAEGVLTPDDIVMTAADPRAVVYMIEGEDGSVREEMRKPKPDVEALQVRVLELLERDGKALMALNAAMFAADASDKIAATKVRLRREAADRLIWGYTLVKATAAGVNPVAAIDVAGAVAIDAAMVFDLARLYQIELSWHNASRLVGTILTAAGIVTLAEVATIFGASLLKGLTAGLSTVLTAPVQAAAAGYGSYIVGQAAKYYLEHGASWAGRSPKQVIQAIIETTDKRSVITRLKAEIRERLKLNPHAE